MFVLPSFVVVVSVMACDNVMDDVRIQYARDAWFDNQQNAINVYCYINDWNTSAVTDMSRLFEDVYWFPHYISNWDTSAVTDMSQMFKNIVWFNGHIHGWDTGSVTDMSRVFDIR